MPSVFVAIVIGGLCQHDTFVGRRPKLNPAAQQRDVFLGQPFFTLGRHLAGVDHLQEIAALGVTLLAMPSQNRGHVLFKSRQRAIRCLNPVLAAQIIAQRVSFVGSRRAIVQEHFGQIAAIERIGRRDAGMLTDG